MYVHINFCMSEERQSYSVYFKDIYYVKFTKQFVGHMASFTSQWLVTARVLSGHKMPVYVHYQRLNIKLESPWRCYKQ